jgi:TM2 domain-containing membrane protein YozV
MKKPSVAFMLSFFLPGAGLAYLGKWKWAVANFCIVLLLGILLGLFLPEDIFTHYARIIAIGFGSASAGLAQALTQQMNLKIKNAQAGGTVDTTINGPRH